MPTVSLSYKIGNCKSDLSRGVMDWEALILYLFNEVVVVNKFMDVSAWILCIGIQEYLLCSF